MRTIALALALVLSLPARGSGQRVVPSSLQRATAPQALFAPQQGRPLSCRAHVIAAAIGGGLGGAAMGWFIGGLVTIGGDDAYVAKTRRWIILGTAVAGAGFAVLEARQSFSCTEEANLRVPVTSQRSAWPNDATDSLVPVPRSASVDPLTRSRPVRLPFRGSIPTVVASA